MPAAVRDSFPDFPEDAVLADLVHELAERVERGEPVVLDEVVREHADHADELRRLFPLLQSLADSDSADPRRDDGSHTADHDGAGGAIGDFQIVREIGRGGMGIVYEALQISLNRRVALKVLPFAAALDSRALARFKQESLAAAQLDHPHIVHVHSVGVDRGVHYYAMQFIEGQSLADVITAMRGKKVEGVEESKGSKRDGPASGGCQPPGAFTTTNVPQQNDRAVRNSGALPSISYQPAYAGRSPADCGAAETVPVRAAGLSTDRDSNPKEFYRAVARLAIEGADALDYAHEHGVVHRDVKPGNLLLDENGKVYITDFGLARIETAQELTATGDLIGTLRYMSPEQATSARGLVDQRSDVYSLGATLYELLTLRPVFTADDRAVLLKKIAEDDPVPPRRIDRSLPSELETILLKCLEKEPARRYATAQGLAEDLTRYLEDKPLSAKPPSRMQRAVKWIRRHKPLVGTAAVLVVLATLLVGGALYDRFERQSLYVSNLLDDAKLLHGQARSSNDNPNSWSIAVAAVRRAEFAAFNIYPGRLLRQRVIALREDVEYEQAAVESRREQTARDQQLLVDMTSARLAGSVVGSLDRGGLDPEGAARAYSHAFFEYGLDLERMDAVEVATRIWQRRIRNEILVGILDWARYAKLTSTSQCQRLLEIAESIACEDPEWEKPLVLALARDNGEELAKLAESLANSVEAPVPLAILANALVQQQQLDRAISLLHAARRRFPDDFWINHYLGVNVFNRAYNSTASASDRTQQYQAALAPLAVAVALSPRNPAVHYNFAQALRETGQSTLALEEYRRVVELKSDHYMARNNLGNLLGSLGDLNGAVAEFSQALQVYPEDAILHCNLGVALTRQWNHDAAETHLRKALQLNPRNAVAHYNLGVVLQKKGEKSAALVEYQNAVDINPDYWQALENLSGLLADAGKLDQALATIQQVLVLRPQVATGFFNYGNFLRMNGDLKGAVAAYDQAVRLRPDYGDAYNNSGIALRDSGDLAGAIAAFRKAVTLTREPNSTVARNNLLLALLSHGDVDGAIDEFQHLVAQSQGDPQLHFSFALQLDQKGYPEQAMLQYRRAIELQPDYPEAHCNLGQMLVNRGDFAKGLDELRRGHVLGINRPDWRYPSAQWVKLAEERVRIDELLKNVLAGKIHAANPSEQVALAEMALSYRQLYVHEYPHLFKKAAEWYCEAIAADPVLAADAARGHRYNAACAAVLAASDGQPGGMTDNERAACRAQACEWLAADLALLGQPPGSPQAAARVVATLQHWLTDPDLAGIRDKQYLSGMTDDERAMCESLWRDVRSLLDLLQSQPRK